ncbi:MAG: hypothetical protein C4335_04365 [Armatimonadota bacterium]
MWKVRQGTDRAYRTARWNQTNWLEMDAPADRDRVARAGLDLLYGVSEIPQMPAVPNEWTGASGGVRLDTVSEFRRGYRSLRTYLASAGEVTRSAPLQEIEIQVKLFPSPQQAMDYLRNPPRGYSAGAVPVGAPAPTYNSGLPSGARMGEVFVVSQPVPQSKSITFVLGRAMVYVQVQGYEAVSLDYLEALAWGVAYRVLHHSELLPSHVKPAGAEGNALLDGVEVAPLSLLRRAGCSLETKRPVQRWSIRVIVPLEEAVNRQISGEALADWRVRVQWGQRWVELEAFSWQMKTWDGRQVQLSRPAFPYRGDLVAPLQEVKQALGIQ